MDLSGSQRRFRRSVWQIPQQIQRQYLQRYGKCRHWAQKSWYFRNFVSQATPVRICSGRTGCLHRQRKHFYRSPGRQRMWMPCCLSDFRWKFTESCLILLQPSATARSSDWCQRPIFRPMRSFMKAAILQRVRKRLQKSSWEIAGCRLAAARSLPARRCWS